MAEFDDLGGRRVNLPSPGAERARRNRRRNRPYVPFIDPDSRPGPGVRTGRSGGGGGEGDAGDSGTFVGTGDIAAVINAALSQRGVPYSWAGGGKKGRSFGTDQGANINGFDCSGLLEYAYWKGAGVDIGGYSGTQSKKGVSVSKDSIQPGDLVYWNRPGVSHIAMYIGGGYMIEAPYTGAQVRVVPFKGSNTLENATSIRRILKGPRAGGGEYRGGEGPGTRQTGKFAQLVTAIKMQESGGRYNVKGAVNSDGDRAYGAFQVMGKNVGDWTQEVLGRRMTPEEFLNDRSAQDKVGIAKLRQYYDRYGMEGAAAAWYGGPGGAKNYLSGKDVNAENGPKLRTYVREVMEKARRAPNGTMVPDSAGYQGGPGGDSSFDADLDRAISEEDMKAAFDKADFSSFVINSSPELKAIFAWAIKEGASDEAVMIKLKESKWYRERSDAQREFDTRKLTDPETWLKSIHDQKELVRSLANGYGVTLTDARLDAMARASLRNGMTDDELKRSVAAEFDYEPRSSHRGAAGDLINQVRDMAHAYGVKPTSEHMAREVKSILKGENTVEGLKNDYIKRAKSRYAHFATELDAGRTLEDLASPYMQSMAQVLEVNPADLNVHDATIQRGLARKDPKTNTSSAMTLWEYEEHLKNDERWLKTNNARDSMLSVGSDLLRSFGLKV